ncbi:MAG: M48 family metallopeptidase [gamma proteobacterium symbiont of Ctena orbiculata]|nr:M48 family metalloprotease [Candidatus Thiodiazotropha taylori]MBT3057463.1 M48 family metalloprotease [Candidatus Thiodiazotropha sp. (ex Lucina pensylvanica)]MBV2093781.1 M48 family metalloprotease [Candidatus Thiodiazotropha sp. (ex Codakia orbicularis)]PUB73609.1 MAG: peptidase M48 [gamma proteobacterium symbiont of Ctena orbiculata]MBT3062473.1 M48 family metalloprotease [Candidatus Thiodiazotropha sp. (ex Lucina pensylvanica)]
MIRRVLKKLSVCLLLTSLLVISGANSQEGDSSIQLPELGSPSDQYLTPRDEARFGREFMRSVRKTGKVLDDPQITEYIQQLGDKLLKQSDAVGQNFTFFVVDQPEINAFAGPGGYIGIYSGLILATQSESELASVIAHEIAHVTQKHLLRAFDAANRMSGKTAALLLASILVGVAGSPDAGLAMATGVQASTIQEQINFTRSNEEEADTVGIQILAKSDFDPRAMPIFFERMTHASRLYESGIPEILRTHPVTTNRIADALGRAEKYSYRQFPGNLSYHLTREALRVRQFKDPSKAVTHFATGLDEGRHLNKEAHIYGHALALTDNRQFDKAERIVDELLRNNPNQIEYILAAVSIAGNKGNNEKVLKILDTYYSLMPENYPLASAYIEALTAANRLGKAREITQQSITLRNNEPRLYRLLSKIEELDNNQAESHRMLAEAFVANGELEPAVQQLEIALNSVNKTDFYQTSRIESRLNKLRDLLKAEQADDKKNN